MSDARFMIHFKGQILYIFDKFVYIFFNVFLIRMEKSANLRGILDPRWGPGRGFKTIPQRR
jgi:hypothetical protein